MKDVKIAYLHGRPAPHPMHGRFAKSVGGVFHFIDAKLRWQDTNRGIAYRFLSWIVNAVSFPNKSKYNIFLIDNLHFSPVIMKILRLISKDQKIIAHMGSHTLFFIYSKRFSKLNHFLHLKCLEYYDGLICEGEMAAELVLKITGDKAPKIYTTFIGVPAERFKGLMNIKADLRSNNILLIAHGPTEFRKWYKGLDIMVRAFAVALKSRPSLKFMVIGEWEEVVINNLFKGLDDRVRSAVNFLGKTNGIDTFLRESTLYLHCSRGDAFPTSTVEAMAAGVVPLVSVWTGTKEVVAKVSSQLVVELDEEEIASRICWFFNLSMEEKHHLSNKCKMVVQDYTEERAIDHYQKTFQKIKEDFQLEQ